MVTKLFAGKFSVFFLLQCKYETKWKEKHTRSLRWESSFQLPLIQLNTEWHATQRSQRRSRNSITINCVRNFWLGVTLLRHKMNENRELMNKRLMLYVPTRDESYCSLSQNSQLNTDTQTHRKHLKIYCILLIILVCMNIFHAVDVFFRFRPISLQWMPFHRLSCLRVRKRFMV